MVCRNKDKAEQAREVIVNESGNTVSVLFAMGAHDVINPLECDTHLVTVGGIHPYC